MRVKTSNYPKITIILIVLLACSYKFYTESWHKRVIESDVISYYSYLPATFIHKDLTLSFIDTSECDPLWKGYFSPTKQDNGKYVIPMTMGASFLYAPGFAIAHIYELSTGGVANGYGSSYRIAISITAIIFLIIGLMFTAKILLQFFSPIITSLVLLLITFATNLLIYATIEPGMTHVYNFALIALFIYINDKWLSKPSTRNSIFLGLCLGLISLIRPTNVLVALFILLWEVSSWDDFKQRINYFIKSWKKLLIIAFMAFIVCVPQMFYWHMQTGKWIFNSYTYALKFNTDISTITNIYNAFFGYRKGWFVYTPIMFIATLGIPFLRGSLKSYRLSILTFFIVFSVVTFSWWCWWYGGSFSARPMIDIYTIMAIPLAYLVSLAFNNKKWLKILTISFITIFIAHGLLQTHQYQNGYIIHYDSNTKESYWHSFGNLRNSYKNYFLMQTPDYDRAIVGRSENLPEKLNLDYQEVDYFKKSEYFSNVDSAETYVLDNFILPEINFNTEAIVAFPVAKYNVVCDDLFLEIDVASNDTVFFNKKYDIYKATDCGKKSAIITCNLNFEDFNASDFNVKFVLKTEKKQYFEFSLVTVILKKTNFLEKISL